MSFYSVFTEVNEKLSNHRRQENVCSIPKIGFRFVFTVSSRPKSKVNEYPAEKYLLSFRELTSKRSNLVYQETIYNTMLLL